MAYQKSAGWNNLPNGVFSPVIYSQKVLKTFRKTSVAEGITNSDYYGEIKDFGDSVKIILEPEITIVPWARGAEIIPQDLTDSDFTLVVDKGQYFSFKMDDLEEAHSHVNFEALATNRAAYDLAQTYDKDVLGYMTGYEQVYPSVIWTVRTTASGTKSRSTAGSDELLAAHQLTKNAFSSAGTGTFSIPVGVKGTKDATPLEVLARFDRLFNEQNVPRDNRWAVVDPGFLELLGDEDSKFMSNDYASGKDAGGLGRTNGVIIQGQKVRGFTLYLSNNLPFLGTGPMTYDTAGSNTHFGFIIAGHMSAACTAQNLAKTESFRSQSFFGDVFRGMQVYGRKILRPEALVRAKWNASK